MSKGGGGGGGGGSGGGVVPHVILVSFIYMLLIFYSREKEGRGMPHCLCFPFSRRTGKSMPQKEGWSSLAPGKLFNEWRGGPLRFIARERKDNTRLVIVACTPWVPPNYRRCFFMIIFLPNSLLIHLALAVFEKVGGRSENEKLSGTVLAQHLTYFLS